MKAKTYYFKSVAYKDNKKKTFLPPIVILHGWMQTKETWDNVAEILSQKRRVIYMDLPGFGESIKNKDFYKYRVEDYTKFIHQLLINLKIKKIDIIAHSFGGRIAVDFTVKYPNNVSHLILFSTAGLKNISLKSLSIDIISKTKIPEVLEKITPQKFEEIKDRISSSDYKASGDRKEIFMNAISFYIDKMIKDIKNKTLIIWGDMDTQLDIRNAHKLKSAIDHSRLEILKGYGHFAHIENPYLFAGIIENYLKKDEKK